MFLAVVAVGWYACDSWWDGVKAQSAAREAQEASARAEASRAAKAYDDAAAAAKAEKARVAAETEAADAARPASERAALAIEALGGATGDLTEAVCKSHRWLDTVGKTDLTKPDVVKAIALLRTKEATQLRADRADFEASRGIVCRDGSGSGCTCHASHQGCCSHHGGVAGCEPVPTLVECPSR